MLKDKDWEHLRQFYQDRGCIVTGGEGFIGSALCVKLTELRASVESLDAKSGFDIGKGSEGLVVDRFQSLEPDTVFHLAAQTEVGKSLKEPANTYRTNVNGTLNVLEGCRASRCRKAVVASTDKVYPEYAVPPTESDPLGFVPNPYARSKQVVEQVVSDYRRFYGLNACVLRPVNTFGRGQWNETTLITKTCMKLLRGEVPELVHPSCSREWMHLDDAVEAYLLAGLDDVRGESIPHTMNVGTGHRFTSKQVIESASVHIGVYREPVCVQPPASDYNQWVDSTLFRGTFRGWTPKPFEESLRETVSWYKRQFESGGHTREDRTHR